MALCWAAFSAFMPCHMTNKDDDDDDDDDVMSSAVLTIAHPCSDPPNLCGMPEHRIKVRYTNFHRFAPKSVTIATYFERSCNEGRINHAYPYLYTYYENLAKIGPVRSGIIISLQGAVKKKESNIGTFYRLSACQR